MPICRPIALAALVLAAIPAAPAATAALQAQAAPARAAAADSLAFPRQFVKWVLSAQGDSAYAHASPKLQEAMQSAASVRAMSARIASRFGERQGTDAEVQFDEGPLKVYIVAMRFSQAPEPGGWVVAYSPATHVVERSSFSALSIVKSRYPQAKLP